MRRRPALACALLGALIVAVLVRPDLPELTGGSSPPRRPNVIVYLVDTLRADHLGLHGYPRETSPVLDRWAEEAVVFDRAYSPCSWTKPSVVSLFTGLGPVGHGVEDRLDAVPPGLRLLAEELKAKGYSTFAAVTNPNVLPQWGFDRGFDVYDDLDSAGHGTRADAVTAWLESRLDELAAGEPFFLYLHLLDPHAPYDPPAPFDTQFPRVPGLPPEISVAAYDGEIAFVDSEFGRVLDLLAARGLAEDALTIFVSDHGEELLDHGAVGHGYSLFEEVVRIPLVMRLPGGAHGGTRVSRPASLVDVFPTVLGVLGERAPEGLDGRDLTRLLRDRPPAWADRELFLSLRTSGPDGHLVRGLLDDGEKYLRRSRPAALESLFDLERDPAESENLASSEPERLRRLAGLLDAHLADRSRGIHLRLLHDPAREPAGCVALLETSGRFTEVSPVRLEAGDGYELSRDGRSLRFECRLENRFQTLRTGRRLIPDEDGLTFLVSPPEAGVVVRELRLADGTQLPLRAGGGGVGTPLPFRFDPTEPAWSVRDASELLGPAGAAATAAPAAWLGVVRAPAPRAELPPEVVERLRALGYVGGAE